MFMGNEKTGIAIIPKIYISQEQHAPESQLQESKLIQSNIPITWTLDGTDFRLDITLPDLGILEVEFPMEVEQLHINGKVVWKNSEAQFETLASPLVQVYPLNTSGLHLTYVSGGAIHILATFPTKAK